MRRIKLKLTWDRYKPTNLTSCSAPQTSHIFKGALGIWEASVNSISLKTKPPQQPGVFCHVCKLFFSYTFKIVISSEWMMKLSFLIFKRKYVICFIGH